MANCPSNVIKGAFFTRHAWLTALLILLGAGLFIISLYSLLAHALLFLPEAEVQRHMLDFSKTLPGWLNTALVWFGNFGSVAPNGVILILCYIYLRRRCDDQFVVILWSYGFGLAIFWVLAEYFDRTRPALPGLLASVPFPSFPSGHMIQTAGLLIPILYFYLPGVRSLAMRWFWVVLFVVYFAAIGLDRLVTNAHYLTDVLAGAGIGIFWAVAVLTVYELARGRGAVAVRRRGTETLGD